MATKAVKATAASKESIMETATWSQNLSNMLQTLFHRTWELPLYPISPMAKAAPLAENSNPTIKRSATPTSWPNLMLAFPFLDPNMITIEIAAYMLAIMFATTAYLETKLRIVNFSCWISVKIWLIWGYERLIGFQSEMITYTRADK